jgi:peptidoglycan/xylan/chitin deacetylase (PgdA/CDA1 family)
MDTPQVVLGLDMETDSGSWTPYWQGLVEGTPRMLGVLEKHGVPATCFFMGEAARVHPEMVRYAKERGFEIGCHALYHETVGDEIFPIPGVKPLLPQEVPLRLKTASEWVAEAAGEMPVSFRSPRLWGSTAVVNALEQLGYVADASLPMYHYTERITAYHPDPSDWTREGSMKLLEIPNFADLTIASEDPYGRDRDQWPLFRTECAEALMRHVTRFVDYVGERGARPVLCFYFHPWEFIDMPPEFTYGEGTVRPMPFLLKNCGDYALAQFDELVAAMKAQGFVFRAARDLAESWDGRS